MGRPFEPGEYRRSSLVLMPAHQPCVVCMWRTQTATSLLETLLGPRLSAATPHLAPLLKEAFGSFQRLDYGTGHETCFALFLCCLTLLRFVEPEPNEQRALVLHVFMQYMRLCWRLQDVYMLEPAGSHGVWGLDDYCFLGYVFGSAQLRGGLPSVCGGRRRGMTTPCRPDRVCGIRDPETSTPGGEFVLFMYRSH